MPHKLCLAPKCPRYAEVRGRCLEHAAEQRKGNRSSNDSFYASRPWRMSRRKQLQSFPFCQYKLASGVECGLIADSVHHIVPIEDGGAKRDPANLQSLCRSHHSTVHRAMDGREGRAA
jgi:5-methylcytosine-specific restriction endonuclease McrA